MTFLPIQGERWRPIKDYDRYLVSDHGRVLNAQRETLISPTRKKTGYLSVGLYINGIRKPKPVRLLVAQTFLPDPLYSDMTCPINLDGDYTNNHYENLLWRGVWFAKEYMKQFGETHRYPNTYASPIQDQETEDVYENSMDACVNNGLLDRDVCTSLETGDRVWPTQQRFKKV